MDRTNGANNDSSTGVRRFKDGPPGTTIERVFMNGVQEELINTILGTAQTPTTSDDTQVMQSIAYMGLGMRNGKIVPSVAANNLTVAIKTLAGNDPSTTNPVYVRIGDNIRKISAALYVTLTGGTDDWDMTSHTFSLFTYLGWDSVNGRTEILLCSQSTYRTYPAANPAAPNQLRLRSAYGSNAGTAIASGHAIQVIGRVDGIVQSAGDNYTGVTATNVVSDPVVELPNTAQVYVPQAVAALDVDWSQGTFFTKSVTASSVFTFSNAVDGQSITLAVTNDAVEHTLTMPAALWKNGSAITVLPASTTNVYTFIRLGGVIYATCVSGME